MKRYLFLGGVSIILLSGVGYWYFFGRKKDEETSIEEFNTNNYNQVEEPVKPKKPSQPKKPTSGSTSTTPVTTNSATNSSVETKIIFPSTNEYPIKKGSKKEYVKQLQLAIMKLYGESILKKYGADGDFGTETKTALSSKGYPTTVDEATYKKIMSLAYPPVTTVVTPASISPTDKENIDIAKNLWFYATTKKLNPLLEQLKRIKNVAHYVKVNELFKTIRLNGVRQTIVNGSLSSFSDNTSKQFISEALRNIGLKYYDEKWNLSGVDERKIITSQETTICSIDGSCNVRVPGETVLGVEVIRGKFNTRFRALNNQILYVPTKHIRYV